MTDRELLELAAKAADYGFLFSRQLETTYEWKIEDSEMKWQWNPLKDDGQALRLAVKLKFLVDVCLDQSEAGNSDCDYQCELHRDSDPYAATRRAIVRAAAEVGKEMNENQ